MDFRAFQSLLNAGFRLRAQEQLMAAGAASFPHMDEKARAQTVQTLEKQSVLARAEETESTGGDLEKLRAWVAIDAMKLGMPVKPRVEAAEDAQDPVGAPESSPDALPED